MSTVMYAFRAKSDDDLQQQIGVARFLATITPVQLPVDFQIFRTSRGLVYRVLEIGVAMEMCMWEQPDIFPQCAYDERADIPEENKLNEAIANEVDHLVRTKQYSIERIEPYKKEQ